MNSKSRTRRAAEEALRLRGWVLRRLLTGVEETVPTASAGAWGSVVRWERCAVLLQQSLSGKVALDQDCAAELGRAAMQETLWILSANAQLRVLAGIAAAEAMPVIMLKGTAEVARGRGVMVTDVDVLATPPDAARLVELLDADGFSRGPRDGPWHLAERSREGAVHIEVHTAVSGFDSPEAIPWQTARSVESMRPLLVLAPHEHAWTVLCQAIRKHPDRRYRIRDLYLIRTALSDSTPEERASLEARVAADEDRIELTQMLAQASDPDYSTPEMKLRLRRLYLLYARRSGDPGTIRGRLWHAAIEGVAAGFLEGWQQKQQLRTHAGQPLWSVRRFVVSLPLALATAVMGRAASWDEFLMREP